MAYSAINERNKNITRKKKKEYKTAKRHTCVRVITGKGESRERERERAEAKAKHKNAIKVVRREEEEGGEIGGQSRKETATVYQTLEGRKKVKERKRLAKQNEVI